jgi:hypothetical protein
LSCLGTRVFSSSLNASFLMSTQCGTTRHIAST